MITRSSLDSSSVVVASESQVNCNMDEDVYILRLNDGAYYRLSIVGSTIFQFIRDPHTVAEVIEHVLGQYEVDRTQCEADLHEVLADLLAQGLVDVIPGMPTTAELAPGG